MKKTVLVIVYNKQLLFSMTTNYFAHCHLHRKCNTKNSINNIRDNKILILKLESALLNQNPLLVKTWYWWLPGAPFSVCRVFFYRSKRLLTCWWDLKATFKERMFIKCLRSQSKKYFRIVSNIHFSTSKC